MVGLLSTLIWLPVLGGLLILALGDRAGAARPDRWLALAISLATFGLSLLLYTEFDFATAQMQFVERMPWISAFNIEYYLGVDGISTPLILLSTFLTPMIIIAGWEVIKKRPAQYFAAFLILEGLMIGVFAALDAMLFYVFWEAMLIPMFLIIGIWGGERRVYATLKFFLYTFLGSVLMLVALVYLYMQSGSFSILDLHQLRIGSTEQIYIFIAFLIAFAVKVPMWPVHTWLPDAHVEAPTGGSVVLAAVLLKMGGYGFIRFSMPIAPDASASLAGFMIALSLIAVVYIGFVALVQQDMKKLIAYSSIAHMGFVTLGFFIVWAILSNPVNSDALAGVSMGITGSMVQMISHGLISGAMFLCVGVLYDRMHSRQIADYGGVINAMPKFGALFVFFAMANAGLPGTSGFVGEFLVILASYQANFWYAFLAATTLILGAAYTLWMIKRVVFGDIANDNVKALHDMNRRESLLLVILAVSVLALGLYPAPLVEMMQPSIDNFISHVIQSKL
ncbi:MAG: NADH-quinone oxidoreductase subunit M [Gammaproteobacteria bacterium]|nr:NADH-quinone oxidoreductase subunit M [Gammaproteobacteria bacterium]